MMTAMSSALVKQQSFYLELEGSSFNFQHILYSFLRTLKKVSKHYFFLDSILICGLGPWWKYQIIYLFCKFLPVRMVIFFFNGGAKIHCCKKWSLKGSDFTDLGLSQMLDILCLIKRAVWGSSPPHLVMCCTFTWKSLHAARVRASIGTVVTIDSS